MSLFDIYKALKEGEISHEQAAEAFGFTPESLTLRMTRHGSKFPRVLKTLDKIANDAITRSEGAEYLQITVRTMNHLMQTYRVVRPLKEYVVRRVGAKVKWEVRKKFAVDLIAGSTTLDEAAESAQVHPRQMRRWVIHLLDKHYGMTWKELTALNLRKRARLADEIETAEGLELAKQQVINDIARGNRQIREEAVARVMAKRARRKVHV